MGEWPGGGAALWVAPVEAGSFSHDCLLSQVTEFLVYFGSCRVRSAA
jgi:hypothetical protein